MAGPPSAPRAAWWVAPLVGGVLLLLVAAGRIFAAPNRPGDVQKGLGVAALGGVAGGLAFSLIAVPLARAGRRHLAGIVVVAVYLAAALAGIAWTGDPSVSVADPLTWIIAAALSIGLGIVFGRSFFDDINPSERV